MLPNLKTNMRIHNNQSTLFPLFTGVTLLFPPTKHENPRIVDAVSKRLIYDIIYAKIYFPNHSKDNLTH